jgi:hypothetical protein
MLWDCDFMHGDGDGEQWVLCEINVSSVAPYPESVLPHMVQAVQKVRATQDL